MQDETAEIEQVQKKTWFNYEHEGISVTFIRALLYTVISLASFFSMTAIGIILWIAFQSYKFSLLTHVPQRDLIQMVQTGVQSHKFDNVEQFQILILGTDQVDNRPDQPVLTDTIMLGNFSIESGKMQLLSLPRDLWSKTYQTKINSLYNYGFERYPNHPEQFTAETLAAMTGLDFKYTLVITLDQLEEIIDSVGGITVNVPTAFVDNKFPRDDVDINSTDPNILYETVSFAAGEQKFDGATALKYIRSRHAEGEEGTDISRSMRQQLVISALMQKVFASETLSDPYKVANLFTFYKNNFDDQIPLVDLITLGKKMFFKNKFDFEIKGESLSIENSTQPGAIFHPDPSQYQNQWVYDISNEEQFRSEVWQKLNIN